MVVWWLLGVVLTFLKIDSAQAAAMMSKSAKKGTSGAMTDASKRRASSPAPCEAPDSFSESEFEKIRDGELVYQHNHDVEDIDEWGTCVIQMNGPQGIMKGLTYAELAVFCAEGSKEHRGYARFIIGRFGGKTGSTQAYDLAKYLEKVGIDLSQDKDAVTKTFRSDARAKAAVKALAKMRGEKSSSSGRKSGYSQ